MSKEEVQSPLPDLTEGEPLKLQAIRPEQHFTTPPARYTEATLVRAMEEKGVGRPSTYARYHLHHSGSGLRGEKGKAPLPTPLGEVVKHAI